MCCRIAFKTGRTPELPFDISESQDEEAAESESESHDGDAEDSVHEDEVHSDKDGDPDFEPGTSSDANKKPSPRDRKKGGKNVKGVQERKRAPRKLKMEEKEAKDDDKSTDGNVSGTLSSITPQLTILLAASPFALPLVQR